MKQTSNSSKDQRPDNTNLNQHKNQNLHKLNKDLKEQMFMIRMMKKKLDQKDQVFDLLHSKYLSILRVKS